MNNSSVLTPTPASVSSVIYAFSAFNFIGLILNSLVIVAAVRPHVIPGRTPLLFLINQLVSEWICTFFGSFTWTIDQDWSVPDNGWGTFACKLWFNRALGATALHATSTNLVLLMVERYVAVVHPLKHDKFTPTLNAFAIFLSWSTGVIRAIYRYLEPGRKGTVCVSIPMDTRIWSFTVALWSLYIPIAVIGGLNGRVICVLKRRRQLVRPHSDNPAVTAPPSLLLHMQLQRGLTSSVCVTCLLSILLASPLAIVNVLMSNGVMENDVKSLLFKAVTYLSSSFYTLSPVIWMFLIHSIRKELGLMFCCRRNGERNVELESRGTSGPPMRNTVHLQEPRK